MSGEKKSGNSMWKSIRKSNMTAITAVLIIMLIIASVATPYFLDPYNIQSLFRDLAFIGMIGVAQSLLLLVGELDLSVGKMASLCGVLCGMMIMYAGLNPWLAMVLGIVIGLLLGLLNGLLITRLRLNSMVATIGMQGLYGGINLVLTKGKAITGIPEQIHFLGKNSIGFVPIPFLIMLLVLAALLFLVKKTRTGRYIYAIGNGREAAKILGIRVDTIRTLLYVIVGGISALAGILYMCRLGSCQYSIGDTWPMMHCVCSHRRRGADRRRRQPVGALIGAAIISVISNLIVLLGVNVYWQSAVSGIVVVLAISFSSISAIVSERKKRKTAV